MSKPPLTTDFSFRGLDGKTYKLADCPPLQNGDTITIKPGMITTMLNFQQNLEAIASIDVATLVKKDAEYGSSWKKRGGVGAFMMLARKWDRLETQMTTLAYAPHPNPKESATPIGDYDIFTRIESEREGANTESILETVRDLRRYLLLVESEIVARSCVDKNYGVQPPPAYVNPDAQPMPERSAANLELLADGPFVPFDKGSALPRIGRIFIYGDQTYKVVCQVDTDTRYGIRLGPLVLGE